MNADQFKAMMAAYVIDWKHALYLQTGNPIHAWSAYDNARKLDVAIPDWVLDYFDASAKALTSTTHASAKAIADALRLGNKGGRLVTRQAKTDVRDLAIVESILHLKNRPTRSELKAMVRAQGLNGDGVDPGDRSDLDILTQVAEEYALSVDRVRAIYREMTRPPKRGTPSKRPA